MPSIINSVTIQVMVEDQPYTVVMLPTLDMHSTPWSGKPPNEIPVQVQMETNGWGVQTVAYGSLHRHTGTLTLKGASAYTGVPKAVEAIKDALSGRLTQPGGFL